MKKFKELDVLRPSRRSLLCGAVGFAATLGLGPGAALGASVADRRLAIAGQQRMECQRISRAALYVGLDIERSSHLKLLDEGRRSFAEALQALRIGDSDMALPPAEEDALLSALDGLDQAWAAFDAEAGEIIAKKAMRSSQVQMVADVDQMLLFLTDTLVAKLTALGARDGSAIAINAATRQQMLIQKMAKEVAQIAIGHETLKAQTALSESIRAFRSSLVVLIDGVPSAGLAPAPASVREALVDVQDTWAGYSAVCRDVAETGIASAFELTAIAAQADPLTTKLDRTLSRYLAI